MGVGLHYVSENGYVFIIILILTIVNYESNKRFYCIRVSPARFTTYAKHLMAN